MAMTGQSHVVGVFRDRALAEQAANELRHAGFRDDQIQLIGGGTGSGLRSLFAGHEAAKDTSTALANFGLTPPEQDYYQRELEAGNTLVAVRGYDRLQEADAILYRHGAYNAGTLPVQMGGNQTIRVRREDVQVNTQIVQTGEIRVHKRVITENRTFTVPVRREELLIEHIATPDRPSAMQVNDPSLVVERRPVSTETTMPLAGQQAQEEVLRDGGMLRIVLREDQVTINRQPVIVEEVIIRKQLVQEVKELQEPVRHEEVHVISHGNPIIQAHGIDIERIE